MAAEAKDYQWSSTKGDIEGLKEPLLSCDGPLDFEIKDWGAYLREADDEELVKGIRN
ncbi:MAG: hypothetical protein RQ824_06645 [bacterium]|nr:hypothetical protein [bacterium]